MSRVAMSPASPGPADITAPAVPPSGQRKAARQGVLSAFSPVPAVITVQGIRPGLHVRDTRPPVADWLCLCGHHERARGKEEVAELTARFRVGECSCPKEVTA